MPINTVKTPRYKVLVGGSLQINGLLPDDTGMFQCFARNLAGEIQTNTYLAVTSAFCTICPPHICICSYQWENGERERELFLKHLCLVIRILINFVSAWKKKNYFCLIQTSYTPWVTYSLLHCVRSVMCVNLSSFIFSTHFRHRSQHYSRAYGQLGDRRHIRHPALWDIRSSAARHHMAERSGANQSSPVHSHTCLSTLLTKEALSGCLLDPDPSETQQSLCDCGIDCRLQWPFDKQRRHLFSNLLR